MEKNNKKRIFSGVQPSGDLHIGNYLGAISQWVNMQNKYECIFCVVDYHAITVKQDPEILRKKIIEIAKIYIASGIDPQKSVIFQQSTITAHTEFAWILNCIVARMSDLKKMTKSAASDLNYIALTDNPDKAAKKIMRAVTDTGSEIKYDLEKKPGISNLLTIYSLLVKKEIKELEKEYQNKMYGEFKKNLAEVVKSFLIDFQKKYNAISDKEVEQIMAQGTKKIKPIADNTLDRVKMKIGVL